MTEHKPWLSLPDEDPPERGLAELMAAARVKAEVMASPPWWKRLFDVVRRPPVLALATLLVLLGGVIIVGRHPGELEAVQPPPTPGAPPPTEPAIHASSITPEPPPPPQQPPQAPPETSRGVKKAPPRLEKTDATKDTATGTTTRMAPDATDTRPDTKPDTRADTNQVELGGQDALEIAAPQVDDAESTRGAKKGSTNGTAKDTAAPADPLARCRAAAAKKDCATAKACAREAEQRDPSVKASNDATLRSCL